MHVIGEIFVIFFEADATFARSSWGALARRDLIVGAARDRTLADRGSVTLRRTLARGHLCLAIA